MKIQTLGAASLLAVLAGALPANAAVYPYTIWEVGVKNGSNTDFAQENGNANAAPGSPTAKDDDWYFAGTYPGPVGVVATDEPLTNFERAMTAGDPTDRVHFNAPQFLIDNPAIGLRLTIPTVSNDPGTATFDVLVNGVNVGTFTENASSQTFYAEFLSGDVNLTTGDNVVTITRHADSTARWTQFDYLQLDATAVPEPASLGLLSLAGLALLRRR
jgi:hypothetical protein